MEVPQNMLLGRIRKKHNNQRLPTTTLQAMEQGQ
jgi:hypothetical protein